MLYINTLRTKKLCHRSAVVQKNYQADTILARSAALKRARVDQQYNYAEFYQRFLFYIFLALFVIVLRLL